MIWQDIVLSIGNALLLIALIPSLLTRHKPAVSTSTLTASGLFVFAGVYASFKLWTAMVITALSALAWLVLAIQKYRLSKVKR